MPDPVVPPVPSTDPAPPPAPEIERENATIKQMREALETSNRAKREADQKAADLAAKLQEIQDKDLSEVERLKRENDELKPLRDAHGKYVSRMEALYQDEIAAVPDDKRPMVEALSKTGDWADRLEAVKAAKALLPTEPGKPAPTPMGAPTAPPRGPATPPAPERQDPRKLGWGAAIALNKPS